MDFDGTLVNGNFHNELFSKKITNERVTAADVKALITKFGFINQAEMLAAIRHAFAQEGAVAIVSLNNFPRAIEFTLLEMGLSTDELAKIFIKAKYQDPKLGKNNYIAEAGNHFDFHDPKKTILADDNRNNVTLARAVEYLAVHVPTVEHHSTEFDHAVGKALPGYISDIYFHIRNCLKAAIQQPNPLRRTHFDWSDWEVTLADENLPDTFGAVSTPDTLLMGYELLCSSTSPSPLRSSLRCSAESPFLTSEEYSAFNSLRVS